MSDQLDRIEAKLDAMHWRPMSTAPRDGTVIEVRFADRDPRLAFVVWVSLRESGQWVAPTEGGDTVAYFNTRAWRPAHLEWVEEFHRRLKDV